MPRKPLVYTNDFPYHITARCNNKEWFFTEKEQVWEIFCNNLNILSHQHGLSVHAFVLMTNHYHMLASTTSNFQLGYIMNLLQKRVSESVNRTTGRINHVFGGTYKGSLITDEYYYGTALKYIFRNPVAARLAPSVENYYFSTIQAFLGNKNYYYSAHINTTSHVFGQHLGLDINQTLRWINTPYRPEVSIKIKEGLRRTKFKVTKLQLKEIEKNYIMTHPRPESN